MIWSTNYLLYFAVGREIFHSIFSFKCCKTYYLINYSKFPSQKVNQKKKKEKEKEKLVYITLINVIVGVVVYTIYYIERLHPIGVGAKA